MKSGDGGHGTECDRAWPKVAPAAAGDSTRRLFDDAATDSAGTCHAIDEPIVIATEQNQPNDPPDLMSAPHSLPNRRPFSRKAAKEQGKKLFAWADRAGIRSPWSAPQHDAARDSIELALALCGPLQARQGEDSPESETLALTSGDLASND